MSHHELVAVPKPWFIVIRIGLAFFSYGCFYVSFWYAWKFNILQYVTAANFLLIFVYFTPLTLLLTFAITAVYISATGDIGEPQKAATVAVAK